MDNTSPFNQENPKSKKKTILIISILALLIIGSVLTIFLINKTSDSNNDNETSGNDGSDNDDDRENYLIIPEWGVKFTIPDTITDVRYFIDNDIAYFFAKPVGANLEFASDLDSNFQAYTRVIIMRGLVTEDTEVYFKRIGDYYFEPGAGGGYTGLFGDEDTAEYEQEAVWGLMRMIETIQALR